jgi:hypothetical protein
VVSQRALVSDLLKDTRHAIVVPNLNLTRDDFHAVPYLTVEVGAVPEDGLPSAWETVLLTERYEIGDDVVSQIRLIVLDVGLFNADIYRVIPAIADPIDPGRRLVEQRWSGGAVGLETRCDAPRR